MPETTDPAIQLYRLCQIFAGFKHDGAPVNAIADFLEVEPCGADHFAALAAISAQFASLAKLYEQIPSNPESKQLALATLKGLRGFLNYA